MVKYLPFILIPVLILGGLGYWRFAVSKTVSPPQVIETQGPLEVSKTLPASTLEDRMQTLEDVIIKLSSQASPQSGSSSVTTNSSFLSSRLSAAESAVTDLKARVSALEKITPVPGPISTQASVYIPLGSGGGPWGDKGWYSTAEYEISLDPGNYPGYKGMVLEVTFRLLEAVGTGSVRLYNLTDSSATSGQVDTTSSSFSLKTSSSFTLPLGTKTYRLQVKSSEGTRLNIQSARIKVNF